MPFDVPLRCTRVPFDFSSGRHLDAAAIAVVTLDVEAPVAAAPFVEPRHQILERGGTAA